MIQLEQASLRYEDGSEALRDVSLTLEPGSLHFLTGPSGAGKSSLMRLLYLARRPTSGSLRIFGKDAANLSRKEIADLRRSIGVVFQDHRLLDHLTVYENVALPLVVAGEKEAGFRGDVLEMLEWVRLQDKLAAYPHSLSGGERQRVAIARAMVSVPEIILADEPTGSVDPEMAERILTLFMEMRSLDHIVLIATHDMRLVEKTGAPILEIRDGQVRQAEQSVEPPQEEGPSGACEAAEAREPAPEPPLREAAPDAGPAPPRASSRPAEAAPILPWNWSSSGMVALIAASMSFLAALVLALHAGADQLAAKWTEALDRRATLTLTLPAAGERTPEEAADAPARRALAIAAGVKGVVAAEALPPETASRLLRQALGEEADGLLELRLIDLRLAEPSGSPEGRAALAALAQALDREGLEADIDAHGEWIEKLRPAAGMVIGLAETALAAIAAICALVVALACSMAMAAQAQVVDLLRLIGAYDRFIARLFVRRFQILVFMGAVAGVSTGALALFVFRLGAYAPPEAGALAPLTPDLALDAGLWARFALTPLALALITTLTARLFVEARLRRLEG